MNQPEAANGRMGILQLTACILFGVATVVAWLGPGFKNSAVLGRYNYWQFWQAILVTAVASSVFLVAAIRPERRRAVGFRLVALWIGIMAGAILTESAAYLLPVRNQMDNPWYFSAGGGFTESEDLPFERPPYLKWRGLSRGDLAAMTGEEDPYAREITFETDWQGFRNSKDLEQADLIAIGDSFTEAGNLPEEESFCYLLGQKLGLKTRNLGRSGYGAGSELVVLKKYGLACRPKIVVWQIAESNDLEDAMRFTKWVAAGRPRFFDSDADHKWRREKAWMQRSPTFRVFKGLQRRRPSPWPSGMFRDQNGAERQVRFLDLPALDGSIRENLWLPFHLESLNEGVKLCRSNNIQLVFIMIPTKYRVLGPYTRMLDTAIATPASVSATGRSGALGGLSKAWCDSLGVAFADATDALEVRAAKGELVYQAFDTHLSAAGHEVVAELLLETLKNLGTLQANSANAEQPQ